MNRSPEAGLKLAGFWDEITGVSEQEDIVIFPE